MTIDPARVITLPAWGIRDEVNQRLASSSRIIVTAAPGAGKSTLLPLTMLETLPEGQKILMLEPRRLAARQIAERMAWILGERVGETVGYRVRFDQCVSEKTRIEVLTEGVLTRRLLTDSALDGVGMVVFDEFHERALMADEGLCLCRELQAVLRPELRLVIMSATLDTDLLKRELDAEVVNCEGRMYPVTIKRVADGTEVAETATNADISRQTAVAVRHVLRETEGDVLVFLPGQATIEQTAEMLADLPNVAVCPLYGQLPQEQQRRALQPDREGRRKVVLATSIAETSLTIDGVRVVVDTGLSRESMFDPRTGLEHLQTRRISKDRAMQRSGRAGRQADGWCYRLYSLATEQRMASNRQPEIQTADLMPLVLDMAIWGETEPLRLPWVTMPSAAKVAQAQQQLRALGALDKEGRVTTSGRQLAQLPCHPRLARMLLDGAHVTEAADIAALLEERDPLPEEKSADLCLRVNYMNYLRERGKEGKNARLLQAAAQYRRMGSGVMGKGVEGSGIVGSGVVGSGGVEDDAYTVGRLLALAWPERVAMKDGPGHYRLANGHEAQLDREDPLGAYPLLAIGAMNGANGWIQLAAPVTEEVLDELVERREKIAWDSRQQQLVAQVERRIGGLVLSRQPLADYSKEEAVGCLVEAVKKDGLTMLDMAAETVGHMQRRIAFVAARHPEAGLPDCSTEMVLARADEWVPLWAEEQGRLRSTLRDWRRLDMAEVLYRGLDYAQQRLLDRCAPTHLTVPTGSRIRVDYRSGSEKPVVSVRLQECFGWLDTPRVDDGQVPVLLELLSPGFKPVQLTADLRSFWQETYFEVRKELRRRYPKHAWPDNPLEAMPTRGVKKRV